MSVHNRWSMVMISKIYSYTKYNASCVILKINRRVKYPEEEDWLIDQINLRWNTGIPISTEYLMQLIRQHFFVESYLMQCSNPHKVKIQPINSCDVLL